MSAWLCFQRLVSAFTLVLGEDVRRGVLVPIAASRRDRAERPRVELGQGADAQGQRRVHKRRLHVVHAEGRGGFAVQQQNFIAYFQTWRKQKFAESTRGLTGTRVCGW